MPKMYYCTKCKRKHKTGKIYNDHLEFQEQEETEIPSNNILLNREGIMSLRPIAQRQIARLLKRLKLTNRRSLYIREINKVIMYERGEL